MTIQLQLDTAAAAAEPHVLWSGLQERIHDAEAQVAIEEEIVEQLRRLVVVPLQQQQ